MSEPEPDIGPEYQRALATWLHACSARVLHLFWGDHPDDPRPVDAVDALAAVAAGQVSAALIQHHAAACRRAADGAASTSARAAALAVEAAVLAATTAHHAPAVFARTLEAIRLGAPGSPELVAAESAWQREQVPRSLRARFYPSGTDTTVDLRPVRLPDAAPAAQPAP